MTQKFPYIYPDIATIRRFKKDTVIYDASSATKYELYLSWHHEHQFVVVSRQGHGAYAIPFPAHGLQYFNYWHIGGNTNGKTVSYELENAGKILYQDDAQYAGRFFKNIFSGLFRARQLVANDSVYLKNNITYFKNDTARKLVSQNYDQLFNQLANEPEKHEAYLSGARGEIYEVNYNLTNAKHPYTLTVYWNPVKKLADVY